MLGRMQAPARGAIARHRGGLPQLRAWHHQPAGPGRPVAARPAKPSSQPCAHPSPARDQGRAPAGAREGIGDGARSQPAARSPQVLQEIRRRTAAAGSRAGQRPQYAGSKDHPVAAEDPAPVDGHLHRFPEISLRSGCRNTSRSRPTRGPPLRHRCGCRRRGPAPAPAGPSCLNTKARVGSGSRPPSGTSSAGAAPPAARPSPHAMPPEPGSAAPPTGCPSRLVNRSPATNPRRAQEGIGKHPLDAHPASRVQLVGA